MRANRLSIKFWRFAEIITETIALPTEINQVLRYLLSYPICGNRFRLGAVSLIFLLSHGDREHIFVRTLKHVFNLIYKELSHRKFNVFPYGGKKSH